MFTVSPNFIANFKIGDNINENLATLKLLYELCHEDSRRVKRLRKPIIVTLVSITEAMLYDFITRVQSGDYISKLPKLTVTEMKDKKYTKLTNFISGAKRHNLFEADEAFYEKIDDLKNCEIVFIYKMRNTISNKTKEMRSMQIVKKTRNRCWSLFANSSRSSTRAVERRTAMLRISNFHGMRTIENHRL